MTDSEDIKKTKVHEHSPADTSKLSVQRAAEHPPQALPQNSQHPAPTPAEQPTLLAGDVNHDSAVQAVSPATQFTQYSGGHNHSAGFAQARALVKQSLKGEQGLLLKKRFLLEEVLGHGGMGTVYKTKDLRKVEAEDPYPYIATKVLNQDFKDHPDAFVTLQQETAKSQTLAHPNIVTVHDFDRDGDTLFMTMELLEGEPLDALLKKYPHGIPQPQVWTITQDLCASLAYAHQRQLIHADFKPGNIFINQEFGAKVLDFGIARAASKEAQKHKFDVGQLGALTPAYASIEMVKDEPLSFSDDVYALACVVYEMLTGRHPFNNRSGLKAFEQKLKPAKIDGLTNRQWKALSHALALRKVERTASIQAFCDELFPKRNPLLATAALGVALVSLLGAAWFGYSEYQNEQERQQAVAEKLAAAEACFQQSDFSCALEQSLIAANMAPENQQAQVLLQQAKIAKAERADEEKIVQLMRDAKACSLSEDWACVQVKAREVISLSAQHNDAKNMLAQANQVIEARNIQALVAQGESCFAQGDVNCAQGFALRVYELNPENEQGQAFARKLQQAQQQTRRLEEAQQRELDTYLAQAQACLAREDFACASAQAVRALGVDAANAQAVEIKQRASFAQQQRQTLAGKVDKLLLQADECMRKKNYACAMAKAESALDLDAGNIAAAALKQKAQDTQRKLKETGLIIK